MGEMLVNSAFFGALLTIGSYLTGLWIKKKFKKAFLNPLLISILLTVGLLLLLRVDYPTYEAGAKYVSYLLTPATVCLAVPLYEQFQLLKKNAKAVLLGIFSGVLTSLGSIFLLSRLFRLDHATYVTLLPKSITTAIGVGVAEELGGYVSLTVAVIKYHQVVITLRRIVGYDCHFTTGNVCHCNGRIFRNSFRRSRGVYFYLSF